MLCPSRHNLSSTGAAKATIFIHVAGIGIGIGIGTGNGIGIVIGIGIGIGVINQHPVRTLLVVLAQPKQPF